MKKAMLLILAAGLLLPAAALAGTEISPYGFVLVNTSYNTRTIGDVPVWAAAPGKGEPNFVITPRQTRLGFKVKSDADYTPAGAIELDFFGLRGSGPNGGPTQTAPRLRRAFMELHFGKVDLLVGQEWILFSPLSPTTNMHVALPGEMASGNLWARLPQIRGTFKPLSDETNEVTAQLALLRPFGADAIMTPVEQGDVFGRGELYGWPWVQGRIGYVMKGDTKLSIGGGVHYGNEDFGKDPDGEEVTGNSMAVCGDLQVGVSKVTISGEGFFGKNIRTLFSSAGYDTTLTSQRQLTDVKEIEAIGGWGEVKVALTETLDVAVNAGVESVDDEHLSDGDVKQNMTVMVAGICKPTGGVEFGLEVGYIDTERIVASPVPAEEKETDDGRQNFNVNFSAMFKF